MPWEYLLDIGLLQAGDQGAQDMKAVLEGCSDMKHSHQNKLDRLFYTQTYCSSYLRTCQIRQTRTGPVKHIVPDFCLFTTTGIPMW